jgi:hypothetical protein
MDEKPYGIRITGLFTFGPLTCVTHGKQIQRGHTQMWKFTLKEDSDLAYSDYRPHRMQDIISTDDHATSQAYDLALTRQPERDKD